MISKIKIICIGKIKQKEFKFLSEEFIKRIKPFCDIEIVELKDKGIDFDSKNIIEKIDSEKLKNIFIMDELGLEYSSIEFSELIKKTDEEIVFVIGGADGLNKEIKNKYKNIRLSKMTLIHEMARFFLIEQIYRSMMIINNRSYHK